MTQVTVILSAIEAGVPQAAEQLLPVVYDELRKLAAKRLARETPGQTLDATALVHEAYVRLVDTDTAKNWNRALLHTDRLTHCAYTRDGRQLLTSDAAWMARIWHAHTGKRIGPPASGHASARTTTPSPFEMAVQWKATVFLCRSREPSPTSLATSNL